MVIRRRYIVAFLSVILISFSYNVVFQFISLNDELGSIILEYELVSSIEVDELTKFIHSTSDLRNSLRYIANEDNRLKFEFDYMDTINVEDIDKIISNRYEDKLRNIHVATIRPTTHENRNIKLILVNLIFWVIFLIGCIGLVSSIIIECFLLRNKVLNYFKKSITYDE